MNHHEEFATLFMNYPQVQNELTRRIIGSPARFIKSYLRCVTHTQLKQWLEQANVHGTSCIGRVEDNIVCTTILNYRSPLKRSRESVDSDDTKRSKSTDTKDTIKNFIRRIYNRRQKGDVEDKEMRLDELRDQLKRVMDQTSGMPTEEELTHALSIIEHSKHLRDVNEEAVHCSVELSYNDRSTSQQGILCPKLILLLHIPANIALGMESVTRLLSSLSEPVDCIYSCDRNPLSKILKPHDTCENARTDHTATHAPSMTIAISIPTTSKSAKETR